MDLLDGKIRYAMPDAGCWILDARFQLYLARRAQNQHQVSSILDIKNT